MDPDTFKEFANAMTDYVANYLENIRDRRPMPSVEPGYLRPLIPSEAPEAPEEWQDVMSDIERVIMPGVTHWQSPRFHAYFNSTTSYPAIVAEMLSSAICCLGFSWAASPALTELEVIIMDWLGKLLDLPQDFLSTSGGKGGGVIQGSASESTFIALLGAKARALRKAQAEHPGWSAYDVMSKLRAYTSNLAHSSVEKAGLLAGVQFVLVETDDKHSVRGDILASAIEADIQAGLIPFYVVATLGTTSCCSFDNLDEIGDVCRAYDIWLHVDAAYAGSAFICTEFRYLMAGIEKTDSFNFNPHKWLLVPFECSAMWVKDPTDIINALKIEATYLKHNYQGLAPEFRHWQIPMGKRFRSLKLWFVMRLYGGEKLRAHIRKQVGLAHSFEALLLKDTRFELFNEVTLGLICFRLKGSNERNEELLRMLNSSGKIHLVSSTVKDTFFLRISIASSLSEESDIQESWAEIQTQASNLDESTGNGLLSALRSNKRCEDSSVVFEYMNPHHPANQGVFTLCCILFIIEYYL